VSLTLATMLLATTGAPSQLAAGDLQQEQRTRLATIDALLTAMAHHDAKAFKASGGEKIAFSSDPDAVFSFVVRPNAPRLAVNSFAGLGSCVAGHPRPIAIDWYTVSWDCPAGGPNVPLQYSFKFAGRNLVAVQATRQPPKFRLN
jgi:hypothetical protein